MRRSLMRIMALAALLLLAAAAAAAGQKELMEAWSAQKRAVTNKVYEQMRQEGKLPRDGTVEFKAHTRPDPQKPGQVVIEVDEVQILPQNGSDASQHNSQQGSHASQTPKRLVTRITPVTLRWQTMDSSDYITYKELDIPVNQELGGRFEVRKGVIVPVPRAQEQSASKQANRLPGEKPGEKAPAEP